MLQLTRGLSLSPSLVASAPTLTSGRSVRTLPQTLQIARQRSASLPSRAMASASGSSSDAPAPVRLTQLSHGGGCGCKIAPNKLQEILQNVALDFGRPELLVGASTSDDAAVYKLNDQQALVLTTDFFMPIVDDPRDFGRVAATNSISDVYAMGGTPILALSVLGMPVDKLPAPVIRQILEGGVEVCREAGIPLAGGHSIDSPEPIFGLVVAGLVHPDRVKANCTAREGDDIILTKPLGVGVMTTALKRGKLSPEGYSQVLATMTQLNKVGAALAARQEVSAITDVTGFGFLGHLMEVCRGSQLRAQVDASCVPVMAPALPLAQEGVFPGAVPRNWDSYGAEVAVHESQDGAALEDWRRKLLCDPQTSGGLLLAVAPHATQAVLRQVRDAGFTQAALVGRFAKPGAGAKPGVDLYPKL